MTSFVRFVFTIVIVGMAVNLAVVLVANARSERRQNRQYQADKARFKDLIATIGGHVRRADIIVESQRLDGHDQALESTLLVRQYRATGASQKDPLPVARITIPGDLLEATGLLLEFDSRFAPGHEDYEMLRNAQLVLFGAFRGADEPAATQPSAAEGSFSFLLRGRVPELIRLEPFDPQPSAFESGLWQYLWQALPEPWDAAKPGPGLKVTWLKTEKAIAVTVRDNHTYTAYASTDGTLTLKPDQPGMADLRGEMEREGKRLPLR